MTRKEIIAKMLEDYRCGRDGLLVEEAAAAAQWAGTKLGDM